MQLSINCNQRPNKASEEVWTANGQVCKESLARMVFLDSSIRRMIHATPGCTVCTSLSERIYISAQRTTIMIYNPKHLNCRSDNSESREAFGDVCFMFLISFSSRFQHLSTLRISRLEPAWIFMSHWVFHNNCCPSKHFHKLSEMIVYCIDNYRQH